MTTPELKPCHLSILAGLARGDTFAQIALRTGRSYHTVKNHIWRLRQVLGAVNFAALVDLGYRSGWLAGLDPEPRPPVVLPPREQQALELIAAGLSDRQIARQWGISLGTAHEHIRSLYKALDARSRAHAVALGHQHGHLAAHAHSNAA